MVGKIYIVILSVNSPTQKCFYVGSGLELRKKILYHKKIIIFDFNVLQHSLWNFVLSSFNLTHLTLDR